MAKDMDMDDARTRYQCPDCGVPRPGTDHERGCRYAEKSSEA